MTIILNRRISGEVPPPVDDIVDHRSMQTALSNRTEIIFTIYPFKGSEATGLDVYV